MVVSPGGDVEGAGDGGFSRRGAGVGGVLTCLLVLCRWWCFCFCFYLLCTKIIWVAQMIFVSNDMTMHSDLGLLFRAL